MTAKKFLVATTFITSVTLNSNIKAQVTDPVATEAAVRQVEATLTRYAAAGFGTQAQAAAVKELVGVGVNPALATAAVENLRSQQQIEQVTSVIRSLAANATSQKKSMSTVLATALQTSVSYTADSALATAVARELTRQPSPEEAEVEALSNVQVTGSEIEAVLVNSVVTTDEAAMAALSRPGSAARHARQRVATIIKIAEQGCLTGAGVSHTKCVEDMTTFAVNLATKHTTTFVTSSTKPERLAANMVRGFPGQLDAQGNAYTTTDNYPKILSGGVIHSGQELLNQDFLSQCLITGGVGAGTF